MWSTLLCCSATEEYEQIAPLMMMRYVIPYASSIAKQRLSSSSNHTADVLQLFTAHCPQCMQPSQCQSNWRGLRVQVCHSNEQFPPILKLRVKINMTRTVRVEWASFLLWKENSTTIEMRTQQSFALRSVCYRVDVDSLRSHNYTVQYNSPSLHFASQYNACNINGQTRPDQTRPDQLYFWNQSLRHKSSQSQSAPHWRSTVEDEKEDKVGQSDDY